MQNERKPTTASNVMSRLFFRFFLAYLAACPIACFLGTKGIPRLAIFGEGDIALLFVLLALLGAFSTISKPYLLLLAFLKGFYDTALLYEVSCLIGTGKIGVLAWNACFLLVLFSLLLFAVAAARAQLFSFVNAKRDMQLLLSGSFWLYLFEAVFFLALALSLYFLWPLLCERLLLPL